MRWGGRCPGAGEGAETGVWLCVWGISSDESVARAYGRVELFEKEKRVHAAARAVSLPTTALKTLKVRLAFKTLSTVLTIHHASGRGLLRLRGLLRRLRRRLLRL